MLFRHFPAPLILNSGASCFSGLKSVEGRTICSTSLSGGNQVDGLPPASSYSKDKLKDRIFIKYNDFVIYEIILENT